MPNVPRGLAAAAVVAAWPAPVGVVEDRTFGDVAEGLEDKAEVASEMAVDRVLGRQAGAHIKMAIVEKGNQR